ncbi:MAG TPA: hypothetical protein VMC08_00690 [Bacteroidales bacterium]|nr:hypothetical protein [Bacteroidales bacterium]
MRTFSRKNQLTYVLGVAGIHSCTLDARQLTSGVYFVLLKYNGEQQAEKIVVMR